MSPFPGYVWIYWVYLDLSISFQVSPSFSLSCLELEQGIEALRKEMLIGLQYWSALLIWAVHGQLNALQLCSAHFRMTGIAIKKSMYKTFVEMKWKIPIKKKKKVSME